MAANLRQRSLYRR